LVEGSPMTSVKGIYANLDDLMRLRYKATGFSFLPRQPVHSILSGRHGSRLRGRGLNFDELRHYLPGDDPRNIDWRVTARTGQPFVRVYTEERDRPVILLIDQRMSMFFGSRRVLKSVAAAEAAAVAAWRTLAVSDRVGAVVFSDDSLEVIPPHRSERRVRWILNSTLVMNRQLKAGRVVESAAQQLNRALERVRPLTRHDALICLISDGEGADEETRRRLSELNNHNDLILLFIYDPLEQELPQAGRLTFSNGLGQLEIDSSRQKLRQAFQQQFSERLEGMKQLSQHAGIPLIPISTERAVLDQVREHIGQHRSAGRRQQR